MNIDVLTVGEEYSRADLSQQNLLCLPGLKGWQQGIYTSTGGAARRPILLFVTLDKENAPENLAYVDYFNQGLFFWESQNQQGPSADLIWRIANHVWKPVIFVRERGVINGVTQKFTYCGSLDRPIIDLTTANPVRIAFRPRDLGDILSLNLQRLVTWRPQDADALRISCYLESEIAQWMTKADEGGSGYIDSPDVRKEFKAWAVRQAKQKYIDAGYEVAGAPVSVPFHLLCGKPSSTKLRRVIVKVTPGNFNTAVLTNSEVSSAREVGAKTDLVVVHGVKTKVGPSQGDSLVQHEGVKIHQNWRASDADLRRTKYGWQLM